MKDTEEIPVYIYIRDGKTRCVCHAAHRRCGKKECERDTVKRDKFYDWESVMRRNRYGK